MEATSLTPSLVAGAPVIGTVVERRSSSYYGPLILGPWRPPDTALVWQLFHRFAIVGECRQGSFLGGLPGRVGVRRESSLTFDPPAGVDCGAGGRS